MTEIRRIGLFGGSFDPVHFGHLNIALQLKELAHLDEVLFCPAFVSPFKVEEAPLATGDQRLEMCKLALEGLEGCSVCDIEVRRGGTSYAIETVKALGRGVHLMLSEDALLRLHLWKDAEDLLKLAPPVIGLRHPVLGGYNPQGFSADVQKLIENGRYKTRIMEISSTDIRRRLARGDYCLGHIMPRKVIDYIHKHRLYWESHEKRSNRDIKSSCSNHL